MKYSVILLLGVSLASHAEEFSFDISSYEKKSYEFGGFLQLGAEYFDLDKDSAFYNLNFPSSEQLNSIERYSGTIELQGLYRFDNSSIQFRAQAESQDDDTSSQQTTNIHELYYAAQPADSLNLEFGKRVLKWGKGYAWNPVGFVERAKDPNDPELSREGFILATADYVRSYEGDLKTFSFTPVILPVVDDINSDYSSQEDTNIAAKFYFLYQDTDIDLMLLNHASRSARIGADFSRNITPNFEVHGELVYIDDQPLTALNAQNQPVTNQDDTTQALVGLRYLTETEITLIVEYFHNGAGYNDAELKRFYSLAHADPVSSPIEYQLAQTARSAAYGLPNPGRDYLYINANKKDIFNIVYLALGLSSIINTNDNSYSITPELIYTGLKNTETRLRYTLLTGDQYSEFGEKQNDDKLELRFRYFY